MNDGDSSNASGARYRYTFLVFAILSSAVYSCAPRQDLTTSPVPLIPSDWKPSLEQVQDELQDAFKRNPNRSQQALNRASQAMADLLDARLFITYVRLFESLDEPARSQFFEEQKKWLEKRADTARESVTSKGGSLGALEYSSAFRKISEERRAELEKRLGEQKRK
jgi:uncharacterized protein YecT (DUF1311 family)